MKKVQRSTLFFIKILVLSVVLIANGYFLGRQNNTRSEEIPTIKNTSSVQYGSSAQGEKSAYFAAAHTDGNDTVVQSGCGLNGTDRNRKHLRVWGYSCKGKDASGYSARRLGLCARHWRIRIQYVQPVQQPSTSCGSAYP